MLLAHIKGAAITASERKTEQTAQMLQTLQVSEFSQHINNAIARYKYLNREGLADAESFAELDKVLEQGQNASANESFRS